MGKVKRKEGGGRYTQPNSQPPPTAALGHIGQAFPIHLPTTPSNQSRCRHLPDASGASKIAAAATISPVLLPSPFLPSLRGWRQGPSQCRVGTWMEEVATTGEGIRSCSIFQPAHLH
jgi:hypothetical protein